VIRSTAVPSMFIAASQVPTATPSSSRDPANSIGVGATEATTSKAEAALEENQTTRRLPNSRERRPAAIMPASVPAPSAASATPRP
jgi:hypothetical protein